MASPRLALARVFAAAALPVYRVDMEDTTPAGKPIVDREKVRLSSQFRSCARITVLQTAPFLIRTFVKIGTYHRLQQFEDGPLPLGDEQQIYTWYVFYKLLANRPCPTRSFLLS